MGQFEGRARDKYTANIGIWGMKLHRFIIVGARVISPVDKVSPREKGARGATQTRSAFV